MLTDLAVVLSKRKGKYGPMADALIKASKKDGFSIRFLGDDLSGFSNIVVFENNFSRLSKFIINSDKSAKVGWWMNDLRDPAEMDSRKLPGQIKYIFICNRHFLKAYRDKFERLVYFMPQHGHNFPVKPFNNDTGHQIVFIGNFHHPVYHKNRMEFIRPLMKKYTFRLETGKKVTYSMGSLYRSTPISLSISPQYSGYTSNRLYNILSSGGFALSLYYPEIERQFENGKHLVWFRTVKEADRLIRFYLKIPEKRKEVAGNGHLLYTLKHSASHRVRNMVDIMEGKTEDFYGYL